jgi:hypothetical protein
MVARVRCFQRTPFVGFWFCSFGGWWFHWVRINLTGISDRGAGQKWSKADRRRRIVEASLEDGMFIPQAKSKMAWQIVR